MLRKVITKVLKHGRQVVGEVLQKQGPKETKDAIRIGLENQPQLPNVVSQAGKVQGINGGESILSRYLARSITRSLAAEMRNKFSLQSSGGSWSIFGGARLQANRLSLYAFVGVGLAANTRWQHGESESFDTVCDQIRGIFKACPTDTLNNSTCTGSIGPGYTLEDFEIGSLIAKGCNAAVYRARLRTNGYVEEQDMQENVVASSEQTDEEDSASSLESDASSLESYASSLESDACSLESDACSTTSTKSQVALQSSPLDLDVTLESDTVSGASSFEILAEEEVACGTSFDPGGLVHDLQWRFGIAPQGGSTVLVNDTGWTDEDGEESIEIIGEGDSDFSGIPDVQAFMQDPELNRDRAGRNQAGMAEDGGVILLGEWDVHIEDTVNLSQQSEIGLSSLPVARSDEVSPENIQPLNANDASFAPAASPESLQALEPGAGLEVPPDPPDLNGSTLQSAQDLDQDYNLAIKMMFNYDAESNAPSILRTMAKELVPARLASLGQADDMVEISHKWKQCHLPPHPYIVDMQGVFVDWFPHLPDAWDQYPDALPERLNPGRGCGRNQTMFLVMKRYPVTLREYLKMNTPTVEEGCRLLTQLVEAVVHMNQHAIAHRDLKSDNILVETTDDGPSLVVSDFGCCTTEGLRIPFTTWEVDRGGNGSLMAPEISSARPGLFRHLDYSKADLWAVGAIAYEIFGCDNPFYRNSRGWKLESRTYSEQQLPPLPGAVPGSIQDIIQLMLRKDMKKRPDASVVANMLQLVQWAPTRWLASRETSAPPPFILEVKRWLLTFAAEVCLGQHWGQGHSVKHELKRVFLSRVCLDDVMNALREL